MSQLTDLVLDALPMVRIACILTAVTCRIILARRTTHPLTQPGQTAAPSGAATSVLSSAPPPRRRTRLAGLLRGTQRTARATAAIATVLAWLHQTGAL